VNAVLVEAAAVAAMAGTAGAVGIAAAQGDHIRVPAASAPEIEHPALSRRSLVTIAAAFSALMLMGPVAALLALGSSTGSAWIGKARRRARLHALMGEQLIDAVAGLGAALRAGLSLERALRFVAAEAQEPLASSLAAFVTDIDLGEPMDRALERWALADGTADARLLVGVLRLDRRSGGDLPRILDQVASTLRERREAEGEVRALTAQARLSGLILGLLPIGFFLFLLVTSTKDVSAALHTPVGIGAVLLGSVLEVVAFLWIRHLLEVR
jgi:tight adherence protein B